MHLTKQLIDETRAPGYPKITTKTIMLQLFSTRAWAIRGYRGHNNPLDKPRDPQAANTAAPRACAESTKFGRGHPPDKTHRLIGLQHIFKSGDEA